MVDLDALVATAKKYLPPPLLLFLSHLIFATWSACWMLLTTLLETESVVNKLGIKTVILTMYCADTWETHIIWLGAVALCVLIALAKYKETSDVKGTIISAIAFLLTLVGIQVVPFYCYSYNKPGPLIFLSVLRVVIDIPLVLVYGAWCKSELQSILPTTG